ncbi:MAG: SDR family NAD(P)-dependent oxidoreductase [Bacteroidales bacterium]|nr:SDR family NAD(P)-dependent oxidoreductase [Bacteroidales bacterium]
MWNYDHIPSQQGKTAIVTGANSGIGYYTTLGLAEKGCEVVMACRNMESAGMAKKELEASLPDAKVHVMKLDLADLSSVKLFAIEFLDKFNKLDLLINNAGLMAIPKRNTVDGFEMQFGVNHLGHFALSGHLFPALKKARGSRIVNVSSAAHGRGELRFHDIHWEKKHSKWKAYGMSKLANLLFTWEMADRINENGLEMLSVAAHPGYADSKLLEKGPAMKGNRLMVSAVRVVNRIVAQSSYMGALPTLYAAVSPDAKNKGYYGPGGFAEMKGYPVRTYPKRGKVNKQDQLKLWKISESLTGVEFKIDR